MGWSKFDTEKMKRIQTHFGGCELAFLSFLISILDVGE